jgi:hypothetical protein
MENTKKWRLIREDELIDLLASTCRSDEDLKNKIDEFEEVYLDENLDTYSKD